MKTIEKKVIKFLSRVLFLKDRCPILYYHDIVKDGEGASYQYTDESIFEMHMKKLSEWGIQTVTFNDIQKEPALLKKKNLVVICFDDGYRSNYEKAFPICQKYGVKFNIFIAGKYVAENDGDFISVEQMQEMYNSGLVGIGAHTWNHVDCCEMQVTDYETEIIKENEFLQQVLDAGATTDFCFPYGSYSKSVLNVLDEMNCYQRIYTSDNSKKRRMKNGVKIGRIAVENTDDENWFKEKVRGCFAPYRILKKVKTFFKRGNN